MCSRLAALSAQQLSHHLLLFVIVASANKLSETTLTTGYNAVNNYRCPTTASASGAQSSNELLCTGLRTGNLLIGRESQIRASSTCGLLRPQTYCNKDRTCYWCDSRKSNITGKPLFPAKDHSIGQVIKRRRYDRQHNVTYARGLVDELLTATNNGSTTMEQQQQQQQQQQQLEQQQQTANTSEQHTWWQAENGAENVTIQLDLENEFLFTHLIMHFNSFYPAQASIERSFDFGHTWHVYQYYATACHATYPNVSKAPKRRINETVCEDLPSLDPSDDGELVMKVLAPTPGYVAKRERTLVDSLDDIGMYNEDLIQEYHELKKIMRVTNLRINLIKLQTLGDELQHNSHNNRDDNGHNKRQQHYDEQTTFVNRENTDDDDDDDERDDDDNGIRGRYHDRMKDERIKTIYHFGLNDLFVYGSCFCNEHSSRCVKQPLVAPLAEASSLYKQQNDSDNAIADAEPDHVETDMVYGHCECQHNTQGANCQECKPFYNDWPWRPQFECKQCQCNDHSQQCRFDAKLFELSNKTSGGICEMCSHNTRGAKCHLCQMGFFRAPDKSIGEPDACQLCQCQTEHGTQNGSALCYQGDGGGGDGALGPQFADDNGLANATEMKTFLARLKQRFSHDKSPLKLSQCLCKANVGGLSCDQCLPGHFNYSADPLYGCQKCPCHPDGTQLAPMEDGHSLQDDRREPPVTLCDPVSGLCRCKDNVTGPKCDTCMEGFYGLEQFGECRACQCDLNLANSSDTSCHPVSGQCKCKQNTFGRRCDQCQDGFWSYPECKPCTCNGHAASCDQSTGECRQCTNYTAGPYCDECLPGYYGQPILPLPNAQSSVGKSMIPASVIPPPNSNEQLVYVACSACSCPGYGPESPEYHASECRSSWAFRQPAQAAANNNQQLAHLQHFVQLPATRTNLSAPAAGGALGAGPREAGGPADLGAMTTRYQQQQQQAFECVCKPGFVGAMCEMCAPNYWGPSGQLGKDCRMCQCNNNWNVSAHHNCDQNTGKCLKCTNDTEGDHCELCRPGYHGDATTQSCSACQCHPNGTRYDPSGSNNYSYLPCDRHTGQCQCADNVQGDKCDQCQLNYWNMTAGVGCERCNCDPEGTLTTAANTAQSNGTTAGAGHGQPVAGANSQAGTQLRACNPLTGQCECKPGYGGRKCNQCGFGFWGDPKSERKCKMCNCNMFGSRSTDCDKSTGQCDCLAEMTGSKCEKCATGYYFNATATLASPTSAASGSSGPHHEGADAHDSLTMDTYNMNLLKDIPSPKSCLRCGECYDQWLAKVAALWHDADRLSVSYRRSASFRAGQSRQQSAHPHSGGLDAFEGHFDSVDASGGHSDSLDARGGHFDSLNGLDRWRDRAKRWASPVSVGSLTPEQEEYIEKKLHFIVRTINQEKIYSDRFLGATHTYNETMFDLLSDVRNFLYPFLANGAQFAGTSANWDRQMGPPIEPHQEGHQRRRQLELESRELSEQIEQVELLKRQLDRDLQQLDEDRIGIETTLLHRSGQPRTDWKLNFIRAQQLFNATGIIEDQIKIVHDKQNKQLLDTRHQYEAATQYLFATNNSNNELFHRLSSFSIERLTLPTTDADLNSDEARCFVTNWASCSRDLRSFQQQQLSDLLQASLVLIQQHNASLYQAANALESEYVNELAQLTDSVMASVTLRIKQRKLEPRLDRFIGGSTELRPDGLASSHTDRLQNSSLAVEKQSSRMENMVKSIQNLTKSYELLLASQRQTDLDTMIASTADNKPSDQALNQLQPLVSVWQAIDAELSGDLWPRWSHLNGTQSRYEHQFEKSIDSLLTRDTDYYLNSIQNYQEFMEQSLESNRAHLDEINKYNSVSSNNFNYIESVLLNSTQIKLNNHNSNQVDLLSTNHSVIRWRTQHNYNLIEAIAGDTNSSLDRLDKILQPTSSHAADDSFADLNSTTELLLATMHKLLPDTTTSGSSDGQNSSSSYLEQLLWVLESKIESDTVRWKQLRHDTNHFKLELESDLKLVHHYGHIENDIQSHGDKLEDQLAVLRSEHNELSRDIKSKWVRYEKCQGSAT